MRRRVSMYQALTEPQLVAGCERTSFFGLVGVCLLFGFFGGVGAGKWPLIVVSVAVFVTGKIALGYAAKRDPQLREVALRSHRYGTDIDAVDRACLHGTKG